MICWGRLFKAFLTNPLWFLPTKEPFRSSCCCGGTGSITEQQWERALLLTLLLNQSADLGISSELHDSLLEFDGEGDGEDTVSQQEITLPFQGLPGRPYYQELARRFHHLSLMTIADEKAQKFVTAEQNYFLVPAESLGLQEIAPPTLDKLPPIATYATTKACREWLNGAGDDGVLRLLGMRKTIGSDPRGLLPPSRKALEEAAAAPHNKGKGTKLSVAARARSKHAHRGEERFFGIVKGNPESQNQETQAIVRKLLNNAAWVNIHVFGGIHDPVLEVRLHNGYGARWKANRESDLQSVTNVEFRGFLEPQMPDGHEKGWKH